MKLGDVLRVWGWYLGICSICTKFEADLWVFPAKFAKTRKLNQTFAYNDIILTSVLSSLCTGTPANLHAALTATAAT